MLLTLNPTSLFLKNGNARMPIWKWLYEYSHIDFNILILALFVGVFISILNFSTAIFLQNLIDNILPNKSLRGLVISILLLFILLIIRSLSSFLRDKMMLIQYKDFNESVTVSFFSKLLNLPISFFDSRKTGDLITRLNDVNKIQQLISTLFGNTIIELILLMNAIVFISFYSIWLGCFLIISSILVLSVTVILQRSLLSIQREAMIANAINESNYIETIKGISTIKSYNKIDLFMQKCKMLYKQLQNKIYLFGQNKIKYGFIIDILISIYSIVLLVLASLMVLNNTIKLGELVAVFQMGAIMVSSCINFSSFNIHLQDAKIAFQRMNNLITLDDEKLSAHELNIDKINTLQILNLSFSFSGRKELLKSISFKVLENEIIFIVGESGQGKSTILSLIQGSYEKTNGEILINNIPIEKYSINSLRDKIGVISQETIIFSGTLGYNICLDDKIIASQRLELILDEYGFKNYFDSFGIGLNTVIGEVGLNISGGQKQIIALARCIFHNPDLFLFDEPTSALDKHTEAFFLQIVQKIRSNKLFIIISHKDCLTAIADRVYNIKNGVMFCQ